MKLEIDFDFHAEDPRDPLSGPELEVNYLTLDGVRLPPMTIRETLPARALLLVVRHHLE